MIEEIGVVIPAADEQDDLPTCLDAVQVARAHAAAAGIAVRVVVVLDRCTDRSAEIVAAAADVESVSIAARNVGRARAAGVAHLLRGHADPERLWLANTDADSEVPQHWLTTMAELAGAGADLVLGTVLPREQLAADLMRLWVEQHILTDGHPHVHGANFGIRAGAYLRLGGWSALTTGEDEDLVERAIACPGVRVVRSGALAVRTSDRLVSRTEHGFARYLAVLDADSAAAGELAG